MYYVPYHEAIYISMRWDPNMHTAPFAYLSLLLPIYNIDLYLGDVIKVHVGIHWILLIENFLVKQTHFQRSSFKFPVPFVFFPRHDVHAWMKNSIQPSVTHLTDQLAQSNNKRWYRSIKEVKWQKNQSYNSSLG